MEKLSKKILFLLSFLMLAISCNKVQKVPLELDNSDPHSLSSDVNWLVITEPYVAAKTEPIWDSSISFHAKKGDVFEIKGKSFSQKNKVWYIVENGFFEDKNVTVFSNYYQAQNYSKTLTDSRK